MLDNKNYTERISANKAHNTGNIDAHSNIIIMLIILLWIDVIIH